MKYMLIIWQREQGCDYMIGCGIKVEEFSAIDGDMAEVKAREIMSDMVHGECHIKRAILVPTEHARIIDVPGINAIADRHLAEQAEEAAERAEYERLRAKYGDPDDR
jgi:hypothetical protein